MRERPTERVRALLDALTATSIVEHVWPYYNGFQFDGEWLDATKGSIIDELDEIDAKVPGTCHNAMPLLPSGMPYPDSWMCSECGGRMDGIILETGNYCPNCGRRVERGDES